MDAGFRPTIMPVHLQTVSWSTIQHAVVIRTRTAIQLRWHTTQITCGAWVQCIRQQLVAQAVRAIKEYRATVQEGDLLRMLVGVQLQPVVHFDTLQLHHLFSYAAKAQSLYLV